MDDVDLHAWVDESIHLDVRSGGFYILAAAVGEPGLALDDAREMLQSIVPRPRQRLHWHDEDERTRAAAVDAIAGLNVVHIVVVRTRVDPRRQERARRKCLERMLFELSGHGVSQAWFESRTQSLNQRDLEIFAALRGSGIITDNIRADFSRPRDEPLLWIPDVVAGAVAVARKAHDERYRRPLADSIDEIEI